MEVRVYWLNGMSVHYMPTEWGDSISRYALKRMSDTDNGGGVGPTTTCLKHTHVEYMYLLAVIAPPAIRRKFSAQRERENK